MSPIDNRTPKGIFKDIINAGKPLFAKSKLQAQRRASLPDSLSNTRALKQNSEAGEREMHPHAPSILTNFADKLTPKEVAQRRQP